MKKEIILLSITIMVLLLTTVVKTEASTTYTNLLSSPSFESWESTPIITTWYTAIHGNDEYFKIDGGIFPNYVNNDSYSLQFTLGDSSLNSNFYQAISLKAGQEYTLELWILDNDPDVSVWISVQRPGDIHSTNSGSDSPDWQLQRLVFTASETATYTCYIFFHDEDLFNDNYCFIDGLGLFEGSSSTNMLVNPDFESWTSTTELTDWYSTIRSRDAFLKLAKGAFPNYVNNDSYGVQFKLGDSDLNSNFYQAVSLAEGQEYTLDLWVLDNDPDVSVWISVQKSGGPYYSTGSGSDSSDWQRQRMIFTASETATYTCYIFFHDEDLFNDNFCFIDGAGLYLGAIVDEFNPVVAIFGVSMLVIALMSIKRKKIQ